MKSAPSQFSFGPFEFDPSQRELRRGGERVSLPSTLNKLLHLLVSHPGQLVTREEIANALWVDQGTVDVENGINGAVRRLRSQLSAGGVRGDSSDLYIETVVGTGYRFVAAVGDVVEGEIADEAVREGETGAEAVRVEPIAGRAPTWRWVAFSVWVLIGLGSLGYGGLKLYQRHVGYAGYGSAALLAMDWSPVTRMEASDELMSQAISPSGMYVATGDRFGISVQTVRGGDAQRLNAPEGLRADDLTWFPDEQRLLASGVRSGKGSSSGLAEAWIVGVSGEAPTLLLGDAALAAVSPDGRRVAYVRGGRSEIWVADADGQKTHRLVGARPGETVNCLIWAPGSERIVVDRSIEARNETDAEKGALDQLQHQNRWAYESYNATSGELLARHDGLRFDSGALLADGRFFYPMVHEGDELKMAVVRTDPVSGAIVSSGPDGLSVGGLGIRAVNVKDLSASGQSGALSAVVERPSSDVYVGDLRYAAAGGMPEMTDVRRLGNHVDSAYPTGWTPGSDQMVFDVGDAGRWVIARQRPDGGAMQILADTGGRAVQGQFTPDGKWILFLHYVGKPSRVQSIDRVAAGGGQSQVVYTSGNIQDFNCSRSSVGRCVLRETVGTQELVFYAVDAEGGRGEELARTPWMPNVLGDWSLSPDGKTVAMANHDARHAGFVLLGLGEAAGGRSTQSIPVSGFGVVLCPTWDVNSKGFFAEMNSAEGYALVYVDLQGNGRLFLKSPDPIWGVQSRDGKRLSFPGRAPLTRNVWVGTLL